MKDEKNSMASLTSSRPAQASEFAPVRLLDIELGQPLPVLSAFDDNNGQPYQRALCFARLHERLIGSVELHFSGGELRPQEYIGHVWEALGPYINMHLQQDGLPCISTLDVTGVPGYGTPRCIEERERFLEDAPFVSVIVATRNRPDRLYNCLEALLAQHYSHYEIIVVDNAPDDDATAELVANTYSH